MVNSDPVERTVQYIFNDKPWQEPHIIRLCTHNELGGAESAEVIFSYAGYTKELIRSRHRR